MYSVLPLILLADWIVSTVFNFVIFNLFGLVIAPFIIILGLDDIFP